MSYDYIRRTYNVPAGDGVRVVYHDPDGDKPGTIVGTVADDPRLVLIHLDGDPEPDVFLPNVGIEYPDGAS